MTKAIRLFLLCLLAAWALAAPAREDVSRVKPDFQKTFDVLTANRIVYNRYNDSIFAFHQHDEWIKFFVRRSQKNHRIYKTNEYLLNEVFDYFDPTLAPDTLPAKDYEELFQVYKTVMRNKKTDHFITYKICDILEDYYNSGRCPDSLNHTLTVHLWHAYTDNVIYTLNNNDTTYNRKVFDNLMYIYHNHNEHLADYKTSRFNALYDLLLSKWVQYKYLTLEQSYQIKKDLEAAIEDLEKNHIASAYIQPARAKLANYEEEIIRNVFLVDSTTLEKSRGDSIVRAYIEKVKKAKNTATNTLYRMLLMRVLIHDITPLEGFREAQRLYIRHREQYRNMRFRDDQLRLYLAPFTTLLYLNDITDLNETEKRKNVKMYCHDIVAAYNNRLDQQYASGYIRQLHTLTTYPRLIKYLTEKERIDFLERLCVATQVNTYAHSVHVGKLAEVVMDGLLKYSPSLLCGTLGHNSASAVKRHAREYRDYIYHAALYHDLGKNSIVSVVNNDYRPLTLLERDIIKRHPEYGLDYLKIAPSLAKYHDTTLGHHKWYNGKGGYPEDFDNTQSPVRIMIDIVTFCDCMQAATERLGRNYKQEKTFDMLMDELRQGSGTQYNPALVQLVDEHPALRQRLSRLVADGWLEIYYDIYSRYFVK